MPPLLKPDSPPPPLLSTPPHFHMNLSAIKYCLRYGKTPDSQLDKKGRVMQFPLDINQVSVSLCKENFVFSVQNYLT